MDNNEERIFTDEEAQDLAYSRGIRMDIVDGYMDGGPPTDAADVSLVLSALNDIDRSTISQARMRNQKKTDDALTNAAVIAGVLLKVGHGSQQQNDLPITDVTPPKELPLALEVKDLHAGETEIENRHVEFEQFDAEAAEL